MAHLPPAPPAPLYEQLAWKLFLRCNGLERAHKVCARQDREAMSNEPPDFRSAQGALLLRKRYYRDIPHLLPWMWAPTGMPLRPYTPVFELDLSSEAWVRIRGSGRWSTLIVAEFSSLMEVFREGPEVALVSRTTKHRQLAMLGFEYRRTPTTPHRLGDSVLRRFYDLVYDPKGPEHVISRKMDLVVESATSCRALIERLERLNARR